MHANGLLSLATMMVVDHHLPLHILSIKKAEESRGFLSICSKMHVHRSTRW